MKIQTTRFGELEVIDVACFEMIIPILGYEDEQKFMLLEHKQQSNFRWLQSLKTPDLAFVVTMPGCFGIEYIFELPDEPQEYLGIQTAEDILTLNIVVIPHENPRESTINLAAPLVFNLHTRKGGQIILTDPKFKVDHPLIQKEAVC
ncbi:MAG: flagellar assembly protein FliW [Candidatus Gastranaerophilales bacterium]|nr:flagellar assembly protein FliW [Candidatus Gastranaerophilales bacterium]